MPELLAVLRALRGHPGEEAESVLREFARHPKPAFRIAAHTVDGVAGMARSSLPMASVIALTTAAGAAIAPASPQPLMPSGFDGHFVTVVSTLRCGRFSARGIV